MSLEFQMNIKFCVRLIDQIGGDREGSDIPNAPLKLTEKTEFNTLLKIHKIDCINGNIYLLYSRTKMFIFL